MEHFPWRPQLKLAYINQSRVHLSVHQSWGSQCLQTCKYGYNTLHGACISQRQLRFPAAVRDPESLTALWLWFPESASISRWTIFKMISSLWTLLWKKPPGCHLYCVNLAREKKIQLSNPSEILTEKHCWWEKVTGYMWRIQCAFIKKNLLTCSPKLLIKALREATEWWTKEPPSPLFNTFKFTGNNSDKI